MSIWSSIADFLTQTAYSAFSGVIEAVRTYFEGDAETRRRVAFSIAMIALSSKMAKADGIVSQHEVRAFQDIFEVPEKEADHVSRLYNLAKQDVAGFESYAVKLLHCVVPRSKTERMSLAVRFPMFSTVCSISPKPMAMYTIRKCSS